MNNICEGEEPAYESKQDTHKEGERKIGTMNNVIFQEATITTTTIFTKVTRSLYIVTNIGQVPYMLFT